MKRLVEFELEDGTTILVESDEPEIKPAVRRGAGATQIAEKAEQTLELALARIKPVASAFIDKMRDFADSPEQVGLEFGIKLGARAGAFIASADSEANFKVSMIWKKKEKSPTAQSQ